MTEDRVKSGDAPLREVERLRRHLSKLSSASLRISASLDLDTVLRETVESARELTGARYGVIATIDETGALRDFVTSGLTDDGRRRLVEWPDGPRLFEHLRGLSEPFRIADVPAFVRPLGFSPERLPSNTLQGTPMRHRGVHVGHFFLAEKEGGQEFTSEDEEILVLFASQAATAIANARTYQDEQRARADLEAVVDTSPVGVVVFDANTGGVLSLNREAKRVVEQLGSPDCPLEDVPRLLTCRLADGREIAFDRFPLSTELARARTVRAEEIVLSTADGRKVTLLCNVTPITAHDGAIASVVVTLQDLAALQELERMRAEFLGMVSHELRSPLTSIKGSTTTVLGVSAGFDAAEMLQFFRLIDEQVDHLTGIIKDLLDVGRIEAGTLSVSPAPSEIAALVDQARNTYMSGGGRHTVVMDIPPELPRVMADPQRIVQVLNNLLSNAARHSPEASPIRVSAEPDGLHVAISVCDLGAGIPPEQLAHLFQKHSGTRDGAQGVRSGLGLAICRGLVEAHGGRIWAKSAGPGRGARFTFTVPMAGTGAVEATEADSVRARRGSVGGRTRQPRVLVVDDDPQTLRSVRDALSTAGYSTLATGNHRDLSSIISAEKPQLVLLDLMLPGTDGIKLMESVPALADLPVIFISGYGRDETIARALESGAADYIVKPFSRIELTARVRAALRRHAEPGRFLLGDLEIDYDLRRVTLAGNPLALTATEYELLRVLSANAGRVVTHSALARQVWNGRRYGNPKLVRAFVRKLRYKLHDDANAPAYILTERGVGYRMPAGDEA